jgi:hypothetical protein
MEVLKLGSISAAKVSGTMPVPGRNSALDSGQRVKLKKHLNGLRASTYARKERLEVLPQLPLKHMIVEV